MPGVGPTGGHLSFWGRGWGRVGGGGRGRGRARLCKFVICGLHKFASGRLPLPRPSLWSVDPQQSRLQRPSQTVTLGCRKKKNDSRLLDSFILSFFSQLGSGKHSISRPTGRSLFCCTYSGRLSAPLGSSSALGRHFLQRLSSSVRLPRGVGRRGEAARVSGCRFMVNGHRH